MSVDAINPEAIGVLDAKQEQVLRGRAAQALLDNPVYAEVWQQMHDEIVERMKAEGVADAERQRILAIQLQQLDRLAMNFTAMVEGGKQADDDIVELRKKLDAEQARLDAKANGFISRGMRNTRSLFASRQ